MRLKFLKFGALCALATTALLMQPKAGSALELRLAHFVPPQHTVTKSVLLPLKEGVAKDSGGEVTIKIYPGGELGKGPLEQYVRVLQGVADITWGLPGYTSSQFPKTMIAEMPTAIPAGMNSYQMFWNAYEKHLKSEFPGTKPLAVWGSEPNIFIMKDKKIRKPSDVKGLKIRVSGAIAAEMVKALGGTPVQMPAGQIYNALQTGLVDGVITGASAVADFKLDEVANSYSLGAPLGHILFYLVMNQKKYDGLSAKGKAAIDAHSGIGLSQKGEEGWKAHAARTIKSMRSKPENTVIDLTKEEIAAFRVIAEKLRAKLVKKLGGEKILATMRGK